MSYILIIIFFIWLVISIWFAFFDHLKLIYLYVLTLPFFSIQFDIGQILTNARIIEMLMFGILIFERRWDKIPIFVFIFLAYTFISSIIWSLFLPEDILSYFSALRGRFRILSQFPALIFKVTPLLFLIHKVTKEEQIIKLLNIFLLSLLAISVLGFIQAIVFYGTGYDLFPLWALKLSDQPNITAVIQGGVLRVSSLAGEPKYLANTLVLGCMFIILSRTFKESPFVQNLKFTNNLVFLIFSIVLISTLSSSGLMTFLIDLAIFPLWLFIVERRLNKFFFVVVGVFIFGSFFIFSENVVSNLIRLRTIERFAGTGFFEDGSEALVAFFLDKPVYLISGTGLGMMHLFVQDYLNPIYFQNLYGKVLDARYGILEVVANGGIIGLAIFLSIWIKALREFKGFLPLSTAGFFRALIFIVVLNYLIYTKSFVNIYLILGIAYSYLKLQKKIGNV